jgi:hypothetical protein
LKPEVCKLRVNWIHLLQPRRIVDALGTEDEEAEDAAAAVVDASAKLAARSSLLAVLARRLVCLRVSAALLDDPSSAPDVYTNRIPLPDPSSAPDVAADVVVASLLLLA